MTAGWVWCVVMTGRVAGMIYIYIDDQWLRVRCEQIKSELN